MNIIYIKNSTDIDKVITDGIIILEIKLDSISYSKLLDKALEYKLEVFKKITTKYQFDNSEYTVGNSNFIPVDLLNNEYNIYLGLSKPTQDKAKVQLLQLKANLLKNEQLNNNYLEHAQSSLVIEYSQGIESALMLDLELFHQYINATAIILTGDESKYFTCTNSKEDNEIIVSKSNRDVEYNYYYLPKLKVYEPKKKIVVLNKLDYKYAIQNLMNKEYILGFIDDLGNNNFFNNKCIENNIENSNTVNYQKKLYPNQSDIMLTIINIVEQYGSVEVYKVSDLKLEQISVLEHDELEYQKLILNYKNCLKNELSMGIELL